MRHQDMEKAGWAGAQALPGLPAPRDSESLLLLRGFLTPLIDAAQSWQALAAALAVKGYRLAFREGHLVILNEDGQGICTGTMLGRPLRSLSLRLGRPCVRASIDGHRGELH